MLIKFWGTRGSVPVPGQSTLKYGGNTPCIEVRTNSGRLVILDAGTGIRELGNVLDKDGFNGEIDVFLSHYHWDHIQGLPFFKPIYNPANRICFYGIQSNGKDVEKVLIDQMHPNNFPIGLNELSASKSFINMVNNRVYNVDNLKIETFQSNHPTPTLVFKLSEGGKSVVYVTDNELYFDERDDSSEKLSSLNPDLLVFCKDAEYLIHDVMFDENSFHKKRGWGHSGNLSAARFSISAGVRNLVFFHYNPDYTDSKIDTLLKEVENIFEGENSSINCIPATEGLTFNV